MNKFIPERILDQIRRAAFRLLADILQEASEMIRIIADEAAPPTPAAPEVPDDGKDKHIV